MNREITYLQIPENHFGEAILDGNSGWTARYAPRWSPAGDAIEWPDGSTFLHGQEVALFLEGYALVGPLIHFAHVVQVLQVFDKRFAPEAGPADPAVVGSRVLMFRERADALVRAFRDEGRPLRNLGALCAWLCRGEVPPVADPPDPLKLGIRLTSGPLLSAMAVERWAASGMAQEVEAPAMTADAFVRTFLKGLDSLKPAEVVDWLRHGRGSIADRGEEIAWAIEMLKPRTLEGALAELGTRERLAGAVPLVAQLVSALTLPPRRLAHQSLPSGGYADVGTRGRPEQILPSQFAVEPDEFIRRFAENELLYFHREEPHAPVTEEVVLLLDQGVRTWGKVRHALAAAALAFGKLAARRGLPLLVGSTAEPGRLLDPTLADAEELGHLWEASDLSPHPAAAAEGTRVFSVAIDEPGRVQFREWRRGVAIKLGDFRVDFRPLREAASRKDLPAADDRGWAGDVEPVGFPFRFGVIHRIHRATFDFDHAGRWLLLSTYRGMLNAWKLDGSRTEIWPRGLVNGEVMEQVEAVLGVADGFIVGGRVWQSRVAMHYHLPTRQVRAFVLGPIGDEEAEWIYSRECHAVVARHDWQVAGIDLATGQIVTLETPRDDRADPGSSRIMRAFERARDRETRRPNLAIRARPADATIDASVFLDAVTGEVTIRDLSPAWEPFIPTANGQPSLRGQRIEQAQARGDVLALVVSSSTGRGAALRLYQGPRGVPTREVGTTSADPGRFVLSHDGRLLALRTSEREIEVRECFGEGPPILKTPKGKAHQDLKVLLGRHGMLIRVGKHASLVRWDRDRLTLSSIAPLELPRSPWPLDREANATTPMPPCLKYDPRRFIACARAELTAVVDVYGQVAMFDARDQLVAMFIAFRGHVAAWLPDGTRCGLNHGPSPLIDGPPTKDAPQAIARALRSAAESGVRLE